MSGNTPPAGRRALPDSTEVVVAGAGVAGSALAYVLGRSGVPTVLLDGGHAGAAGASTVPAALINPHRGRTARASPADLQGAQAFWRLLADLERDVGPSGARKTGVLRIADNARQARSWQVMPGTAWLEPSEVPAEYHAPFGGLLVPSGGWINTRQFLSSLAEGASRHSVQVRWGAEFLGVEAEARTVSGPYASGGARLRAFVRVRPDGTASSISCRAVIIATGAWQPERMRLPRFELVWGEARVLNLGFTPQLPLAGSVVAAFQDGRAMVSGGHRHVGWLGQGESAALAGEVALLPGQRTSAGWPAYGPEGSEKDSQGPDLKRALTWHLPGAADATELSRWQGVRAKRPSGEPVVRKLQPGVHLLAAFGGRGFLRAAAAANSLAERLTNQLT